MIAKIKSFTVSLVFITAVAVVYLDLFVWRVVV